MKCASIKKGDIVYRTDPDYSEERSTSWRWKVELAKIRNQEVPELPEDLEVGIYVGDNTCGLSPLCPYMDDYHHLILTGTEMIVMSERNFVAVDPEDGRLQFFMNTEPKYLDAYVQDNY